METFEENLETKLKNNLQEELNNATKTMLESQNHMIDDINKLSDKVQM